MLVIDVGVKFRTVSVKCANIFDQDCSPLSGLVKIAAIPKYDLRAPKKLAPIKCTTNRFKNYFIPSSVERFNNS
jgi:hypothetical protein